MIVLPRATKLRTPATASANVAGSGTATRLATKKPEVPSVNWTPKAG